MRYFLVQSKINNDFNGDKRLYPNKNDDRNFLFELILLSNKFHHNYINDMTVWSCFFQGLRDRHLNEGEVI
jgi:hypothetical protein